MKIKDYQPHIDGLRGFAVIPVILFHADIFLFNGGYVGVDIFFVISGFLITKIIIEDLSKNKFKLKNFYLRRARRILPILYFVTFFSLIISLFLMSEVEIKFFSKQIISVILFFSNFFFWKNTGYFDPNAETQPLLHTWSLSIEEQFYVFFPIILFIFWKFFKKKLVIILSLIIFYSLSLSQLGGNFKIDNLSLNYPYFKIPFDFFWQAGSANFYLPFGRVWELLTGSLIAIFLKKKKIKDKKLNSNLSFLGIFLIIISIFTYNSNIQYPSLFTILPVIGTTLVIIFSTKSTYVYKTLSFKPLVFFGLISFSLYLWHQPLFAFNRIYFGNDLNIIHKIIIIIFTFVISAFSWKFIEKPFREKKKISDKKAITILLSTALIIISSSFLIYHSKLNFLKSQLPLEISNTFAREIPKNCFDLDYAHLNQKKWYCEVGDKTKEISFAIIGDSHALALKPIFDEVGKLKNKKGIFTGFSGCPGLLGINSLRADKNIRNCKLLNEKFFKFVKDNKIKKIILASRWNYYTVGNHAKTNYNLISKDGYLFSNKNFTKKSFIFGINKTLESYSLLNADIIFIHQIPEQIYTPKYAFQKSIINNKVNTEKLSSFSVKYKTHLKHSNFVRENMNKIQGDFDNLKQIDFDKIFCDKNKCNLGEDKISYYSDKNHLSILGSFKVMNEIKKIID